MKHKASSNLPYSVQSSSRTGMDKSDQTSMDGASNAATVTSKKPQQKGNTPSMDPAKSPSALANQEVKNIPRGTERDVPGRAGAATAQAAGEATEAPYAKVRNSPRCQQGNPTAAAWLSTPMCTGGFSGISCHSSTAGKPQYCWEHSWGAGGFPWETLLAEKDLKSGKSFTNN